MILIPTACQPSKTNAGLDVIRRIFSSDLSAEATITASPARYIADSAVPYTTTYGITSGLPVLYDEMYLMDIQARETGLKACEVDYIFHGSLTGDLPAPHHENGQTSVSAQAQSILGNLSLSVLSPTKILSWISRAPGDTSAITSVPASGGYFIVSGSIHMTQGSAVVTGSNFV